MATSSSKSREVAIVQNIEPYSLQSPGQRLFGVADTLDFLSMLQGTLCNDFENGPKQEAICWVGVIQVALRGQRAAPFPPDKQSRRSSLVWRRRCPLPQEQVQQRSYVSNGIINYSQKDNTKENSLHIMVECGSFFINHIVCKDSLLHNNLTTGCLTNYVPDRYSML